MLPRGFEGLWSWLSICLLVSWFFFSGRMSGDVNFISRLHNYI